MATDDDWSEDSRSDDQYSSDDDDFSLSISNDSESEEDDEKAPIRPTVGRILRPGVLEQASGLFGETAYKHVYAARRFIPYRDSGRMEMLSVLYQSPYYPDENLIDGFLSKLSFEELNAIDNETGSSILHLATKYNRVDFDTSEFYSSDFRRAIPKSEKSVVRWLLENSNFVQKFARTKGGRTAFHAAIEATANPCHGFVSENFEGGNLWGNMGTCFVAREALATMLHNDDFSKACLNVPDIRGLCPLACALDQATERSSRSLGLRFRDPQVSESTNFSVADYKRTVYNAHDTSIFRFQRDFVDAAMMILENEHLDLHGMFGVIQEQMNQPKPIVLLPGVDKLIHSRLCCTDPVPGLQALSNFSSNANFKYHSDSPSKPPIQHSQVVKCILSENRGKLNDDVKARAMVTCITARGDWIFHPSKMNEKESGTVLRNFFVKHAEVSLQAIEEHRGSLLEEADQLLLNPIFKRLHRKFELVSENWNLVLEFAGWRDFVSKPMRALERKNKALNKEVANFFLGGIGSCLKRKYLLPSSAWVHVLEFSGWKTDLPSINVLPKVPRKSRKRKR